MMTRRHAAVACAASLSAWAAENKVDPSERIRLYRVPAAGLQPQVVSDSRGTLHLVYYTGDPHHGDLFYVRSKDGGASFSAAVSVNGGGGSAIAAGTIRGAQLALGPGGRVHVAWNGSGQGGSAGPINPDSGKPGAPMLYTRLTDAGDAFEPERNLMHHSFGLDGGGSVASDRSGNIYVAWHGIGESEAKAGGLEGEARRQVWVTKSEDNGRSFLPEKKAWAQLTGACGCCGMKVFADHVGNISGLYRSATQSVHRDIYLLSSNDHGRSFEGDLLHKWELNACPMSSMDIAGNSSLVVGAWETGGQVYWARLSGAAGQKGQPVSAPGEGKGRKHPRVAINQNGGVLLVWTEGTGWQRGGSLAYQLYDSAGKAIAERKQVSGIAPWSFAAVVARPDGFSILY